MSDRHPAFLPVIFLGGILFGFGLGLSEMARPEVVLSFLELRDFGLLFVMGGAATLTGIVYYVAPRYLGNAPLTGDPYLPRVKEMDSNVLVGGGIFGIGWGLSGICPGAAYASLGIGNVVILYGIGGMFVGAYLQGWWRSTRSSTPASAAGAD